MSKFDVIIQYVNEIKCKLIADKELLNVLREKFSFFADGYKYTPLFKQGRWDGRINMVDQKGQFPSGLIKDLAQFCKEENITVKIEDIHHYMPDKTITDEYVQYLASTVVFPPYDYQIKSVKVALSNKKQLILSPTGCLDKSELIDVYRNKTKVKVQISEIYDENVDTFIDTPDGLSLISNVYKKNGDGYLVHFSDGSKLKCGVDHLVTDDNEQYDWKTFKQLSVGDMLNGKRISKILSVPPQDWYDFTVENETQSYYHKGLLHHNSGKSCIAYMMFRHCLKNNIPMLITVPSTNLVEQLYSDFESYVSDGLDVSKHVSKLYGGQDKTDLHNVVISTWQTAKTMPNEWFEQFNFYLCDEAHNAKAKVLSEIIELMPYCQYRVGMTGTLSGSNIHEIEMNARFGRIFKMVTTRELIDRGILTEIEIYCQKLTYSKTEKSLFHKFVGGNYQKEIDYLVESNVRNQYMMNLALNLQDTSLMLFNRVETHGVKMFDIMQEKAIEYFKRIYFISGKVSSKEREEIRKTLDDDYPNFYELYTENGSFIRFDEKDIDIDVLNKLNGTVLSLSDLPDDLDYYESGDVHNQKVISINKKVGSYILLASYGTLAVGVNIKNLHHLLLCHPYKGKIINLQSIGRILRKSNAKSKVYLHDFIDDFRNGRRVNHTYKHGEQRIEIYEHEEFDYDVDIVNIGE